MTMLLPEQVDAFRQTQDICGRLAVDVVVIGAIAYRPARRGRVSFSGTSASCLRRARHSCPRPLRDIVILVGEVAKAAEAYEAGTAGAQDLVLTALRGLVTLYPAHIWKEDYHPLFPMALKVVAAEDERAKPGVRRRREAIGLDTHERLERLAADLERRVRSET
jgi:hypothetical protein